MLRLEENYLGTIQFRKFEDEINCIGLKKWYVVGIEV
jgi:hypothetical protein